MKQQLTQQEFWELFGKLFEGLSVPGKQGSLGTATQPWRELRSKLLLSGFPDRKVCEMAVRKLFAKPELLAACEDALERLEYVVSTQPDFIGYGPRYQTIENLKRVIVAEREGTASKAVSDAALNEAAPNLLEAIDLALIYLEDGAVNTAADRLRAATAQARRKGAQKVVPDAVMIEDLTAALEWLVPAAECPIVTHHPTNCGYCRALKLIAKVRGKGVSGG